MVGVCSHENQCEHVNAYELSAHSMSIKNVIAHVIHFIVALAQDLLVTCLKEQMPITLSM